MFPRPGEIIGIRARVGDVFLGDPVPRDPSILEQMVVEDASGRRPVIGRDGADPAGLLRVVAPGLHVIGYFGKPSRVELAAEQVQHLPPRRRARRRRGRQSPAESIRLRSSRAVHAVRQDARLARRPKPRSTGSSAWMRDRARGGAQPVRARTGPGVARALTYEGRPITGALVVAQEPTTRLREDLRTVGPGRPRPAPAAGRRDVAHQGGPHGPAPADANADWVELLGLADVRAAGAPPRPRGRS